MTSKHRTVPNLPAPALATMIIKYLIAPLAFVLFFISSIFAMPQGAGKSEVNDFIKFYPKLEKKAQKLEAILALEKVSTYEAAEALVPILKDEDGDIRNTIIKVLAANNSPESVNYLIGILKKKDNAIRPGVIQVLGIGKRAEARLEIEKLIKDTDWLTRTRSAEALGRIGAPESAELLLPLTKDAESNVRVAAIDGIAAIGQEASAPALIAALTDKNWRVRASAIAGLGRVRSKDALAPLVGIVESDEGRLVEDASKTLKLLTGRDFGKDYNSWKRWYDAYGKDPNYKLPTVQELAAIDAKREAAPRAGETGVVKERKIAEFLGVETPSKKILFIIDCSGSMEDLVVEKERYRDRKYPGFRKMDIVKEELARTIERLDTKTDFAIATFATKVKPWKRGELVNANSINRAAAVDFARSLEPIGGASKQDLASAGFGGAAALGEGKTNTHGALMHGLGNPKRGVIEKDYTTQIDTIFFLSDGKPSTGDLVDTDDILAAVYEANSQKKITIHVLGIGDFEKGFMKQLAEHNGGVFVDLGK
ncbi:MAG: HEAT repeat domain-containing protein [Planctomycetota bacterium]